MKDSARGRNRTQATTLKHASAGTGIDLPPALDGAQLLNDLARSLISHRGELLCLNDLHGFPSRFGCSFGELLSLRCR